MAVTLTVETGAGVANANSYVTRADFIAFALNLGVTITDDTTADVMLIKAATYIDSFEANMKGMRLVKDQAMAFPRIGLIIADWYWDSDEIPLQVKNAQYLFALDVNAGYDLWNRPQNPGLAKKRTKVDVIETEYMDVMGSSQPLSYSSKADAWLSQILERNGLRLVRS